MAVKNCFIRGSVVRYVQLPAEHVDTQLLEDATRRGTYLDSKLHHLFLLLTSFVFTRRGAEPGQTVVFLMISLGVRGCLRVDVIPGRFQRESGILSNFTRSASASARSAILYDICEEKYRNSCTGNIFDSSEILRGNLFMRQFTRSHFRFLWVPPYFDRSVCAGRDHLTGIGRVMFRPSNHLFMYFRRRIWLQHLRLWCACKY